MSVSQLAGPLSDALRGRVERGFPLRTLTTYRLGGDAELFAEPTDMEDLEAMVRVITVESSVAFPVTVLGRGSNLVVSDRGLDGLVLRLGPGFADLRASGDRGLVAGAAAPLPQVANWAARRRLAGLEFLVAVPGSVGGAVVMNAGAHGSEISNTLASARVLKLDSMSVEERPATALKLSYRRSALGSTEVVLAGTFELRPDDENAIRIRMEQYRRHRSQTQPPAVQNAGSVFKNPPGDSAGRLVEAAGLKGFRVGDTLVSERHANFFIAGEDATAQDVFDLVHEVKRRVARRFGVELEPEINFVGHFEDASSSAGA
jgi:UDP-N-acetylmuramate dehydrogenase